MTRKRKIKLLVFLLTTCFAVAVCSMLNHRPHVSEVFTTQCPGELKITWHTMRVAWKSKVEPQSNWPAVADTVFDDVHLYTVTNGTLLCLDKLSGIKVWTAKLASSSASGYEGPDWLPRVVGGYVFAAQVSRANRTMPSHNPRLCCFDKLTGGLLWENEIDTQIASAVAYSDSRIMVPLSSGEVECLATPSGEQLWRRQVSVAHYTPGKQYRSSVTQIQANNQFCVVRAGSAHFLSLDPVTGNILWSKSFSGNTTHDEDADRDEVPFTLHNASVYLIPGPMKVLAWSAATGAVLWRHLNTSTKGNAKDDVEQSGVPITIGKLLLVPYGKSWAALRIMNGSIAWDHLSLSVPGESDYFTITFDPSIANARTLYVEQSTDPVIRRSRQACRSTGRVSDAVAIDVFSGREKWRSQLDVIDYAQQLLPDGENLYVQSLDMLAALGPGKINNLPLTGSGRTQLAFSMIEQLANWNPTSDSLFIKLMKRIPLIGKWFDHDVDSSDTKAKLTLLELKEDSVRPLLELLEHQIKDIETNKSRLSVPGMDERALAIPLDLLLVLMAYSAVSALIKDLKSTKTALVRSSITELLIRLNDPTAMQALFDYAKGCSDAEGIDGEETIRYLCRFAPHESAHGQKGVTQAGLTAYLLERLSDSKSPAWMQRFAVIELQRDRGDAAREIVASLIRQSNFARMMPELSALSVRDDVKSSLSRGSSNPFQPNNRTRDNSGVWWGPFTCKYFGQSDLWVVQSRNGIHWSQPTVAVSDASDIDNASISWRHTQGKVGEDLVLEYKVMYGRPPKHFHVPIREVYRDTDHDGIPDIVEREIGTDPFSRDSRHTGLSDGSNKNPLYIPHRLTREEQIYQAVIEAICEYSRAPFLYGNDRSKAESKSPIDPFSVLTIEPGPNKRHGVPIYSHALPVLFRTASYPIDRETLYVGQPATAHMSFCKPMIGLDNRTGAADRFAVQMPIDDDAKPFSEQFPYQMSADGGHARISVLMRDGYYDVEVDLYNGAWTPVECTYDGNTSRYYTWFAAAPVRDEPAH